MIDDILLESEDRMIHSVEHAREDLTTIRTGRRSELRMAFSISAITDIS